MLSTLVPKTEPVPVIEDPAVIEATRLWRTAQAAREQLRPKYERTKLLANKPPNMRLDELPATEQEQDEAFALFPEVARQYHELTVAEQRARHAYEQAHAAAYTARKAWHDARLRQKERELVDVIATVVHDRVREIHDVIDEAGREEIPVTLTATDFPAIPLRLGNAMQGGLEVVVQQVRTLMARS